MSGHSKWSTIKRQKGVADIKRGQTFTKLANAITIAVKLGGSGDSASNPRLRMEVEEARGVNMPKENIQRAIDRGLGKLPGQTLEEVLFEGFGPGKVAFLLEGVTDNKMRTYAEVKNIFEKAGGSLAGQGSVAYMFDRKGEIKVTVIATNFPNDLPRKTLFSGTNNGNQNLLKEENTQMAKKEIQNSMKNAKIDNNDFIKKAGKKPEIEEIIIDDDNDDWSAVPAFLRRNKK